MTSSIAARAQETRTYHQQNFSTTSSSTSKKPVGGCRSPKAADAPFAPSPPSSYYMQIYGAHSCSFQQRWL